MQNNSAATNRTEDEEDDPLRETKNISLDAAKELIEAAEEKAEEIGVPSIITIVNAEGNLVAQHRMDDAWLPSVNISQQKAYTSAGFGMPTEALADLTQPGESLYGLQETDQGRLVIFGGGIPLESDDQVVGAVGSSGGQVSEDIQVAQAAVDKFNELTE